MEIQAKSSFPRDTRRSVTAARPVAARAARVRRVPERAPSRPLIAALALARAADCEGRLPAAWYADPGDAARRALGLRGVPVVLGLDDRSIRWTLSDGLSDPRTQRSILVSWR